MGKNSRSGADGLSAGRVGGSRWWGIIAGLVCLTAAVSLLFVNEVRFVRRFKAIQGGPGPAVSVRMDRIHPTNDWKLVHLTGPAITGETLTDPEFGISVNAIKLRRVVRMYQWRERPASPAAPETTVGQSGAPAPIYETDWAEAAIDSTGFQEPDGHWNPPAIPFPDRVLVADKVTVGAFTLSSPLVDRIERYVRLPLSEEDLLKLPPDLQTRATVDDGELFFGEDPDAPAVGDLRVGFYVVEPTTVSVVARQNGNTLSAYPAPTGTVALLRVGAHGAESMFRVARRESAAAPWVLRVVGFLLMIAGSIPLVRRVADGGAAAHFGISLMMAAALACLTLAVAWIGVRPILAGILIGTAGAFLMGIKMLPRPETG